VSNPDAVTEGNTGTPAPVTVAVADHVTITDVDANDLHTAYVADTLAFDATDSTGPAPSGGSLADLFTLNQVDGTISYDKAAFDYLSAGEHVVAKFTFNASSGPDTQTETIAVTIDGANEATTALVVNFEDLPPPTNSFQSIPDGYHNFVWHVPSSTNLYDLDSNGFLGTGYSAGNIGPGHVVAFTPFALQPIDIHKTDSSSFVFDGVYLTSAWDATQQVTLKGYNNGVLVGSDTVTINNLAPTLTHENWGPINDLVISNTGSQLVLDNFMFHI
jgi:VCBS repeat-containing protein